MEASHTEATEPHGPNALTTADMFSAESEAEACRRVLGLRAHGLEHMLCA